jgi:hypothetical protein
LTRLWADAKRLTMQQCAFPRFFGLALLLCAGCAEDFVGIEPPADARFYFPGRMTQSSDGSTVYIVNTNFDQQFTAGWISVLDTNTLVDAIIQGTDPTVAVDPNLLLKVPTLGGQLVLDPNFGSDPNTVRGYMPSRSNGLLTTVDITNNTQLSCGDSNNDQGLPYALRRTDCAASHLFNFTLNPAPNNVGNLKMTTDFADPLVAAILPGNTAQYPNTPERLLVVGFMSSPWVEVLDPTQSNLVPLRVIYLGNTATLSLTQAPKNYPGQFIAGSHVVNASIDRGKLYFVDAAGSVQNNADTMQTPYNLNGDMGSYELASLTLNGNQLYAASRSPDALLSISLGNPNTYGAQLLTGSTAVASSSPTSVLYLGERGASENDLVAMTSASQDTLYFFTPQGNRLQLVQRVALPNGAGPFDLTRVKRNGKDLLLVTTFFDHGLSIIDITPSQPSQFSVAATIHQGDLGVAARFR